MKAYFTRTDWRKKGFSWHFCSASFMVVFSFLPTVCPGTFQTLPSPPPLALFFFLVLNVMWYLSHRVAAATACVLYFESIAEYQGERKGRRGFSLAVTKPSGIPLGKMHLFWFPFTVFSHKTLDIFSLGLQVLYLVRLILLSYHSAQLFLSKLYYISIIPSLSTGFVYFFLPIIFYRSLQCKKF